MMRRAEIIEILKQDIMRLEGYKQSAPLRVGLEFLQDGAFPLGAVHEFLSPSMENLTATAGFISGLLSNIMSASGVAVWISNHRKIFPPGLAGYGVDPSRVIFIEVKKEADIAWVMEEALKCAPLSAVVSEMEELTFTASRRLQLAVEQSHVTGFVVRRNCRKVNTTACVSRWQISSLPGVDIDDLPGMGYTRWRVDLLKIKNGLPGTWDIRWVQGRFQVNPLTPAQSEPATWRLTQTG